MKEWSRKVKLERPERYKQIQDTNRLYRERPEVKERMKVIRHEHYLRNKEKFRIASKRWKRNHPEKAWNIKIRNIWGRTGMHDYKAIRESELFVSNEVLPKLGFTDIITATNIWGSSFPVDIIAKKDGVLCGIDATLCWEKKVAPTQKEFIKRFGTRFFVCFIKPDFSWYFLKELTPEVSHASVGGIFIEKILGKQNQFIKRGIEI